MGKDIPFYSYNRNFSGVMWWSAQVTAAVYGVKGWIKPFVDIYMSPARAQLILSCQGAVNLPWFISRSTEEGKITLVIRCSCSPEFAWTIKIIFTPVPFFWKMRNFSGSHFIEKRGKWGGKGWRKWWIFLYWHKFSAAVVRPLLHFKL